MSAGDIAQRLAAGNTTPDAVAEVHVPADTYVRWILQSLDRVRGMTPEQRTNLLPLLGRIDADLSSAIQHDDGDDDQVGYICKSCGGPSPLGVGYVDNSAGAAERSAGRTRCDCGNSRSAVEES